MSAERDRFDYEPPSCGDVWYWPDADGGPGTFRAIVSVHSGIAWFQAEVGETEWTTIGGGVRIATRRVEAWGAPLDTWPPAGGRRVR